MLRRVLYFVALVSMLVGLVGFAAPMPVVKAGGGDPIWAPDFEIHVYGVPDKVVAGEAFEITLSAGSESAGPGAYEFVTIKAEGGEATLESKVTNEIGVVTATVVFTQAGSANLSVTVGTNEEFTHTVQTGENLIGIAEANGDKYPEIHKRNQGVVGIDPNRLVEGQVLDIVRYAPSRVLSLKVLPAEAAKVELEEPVGVIAGELPQVVGMLQDQYDNPTSGTITVTLEAEEVEATVNADGKFQVNFTTIYTQSTNVSGVCLGLHVAYAGKIEGMPFCVAPSKPTSLLFADPLPTELEAGTGFYPFEVGVTDKFDNPVSDLVVSMGTVTNTTDIAGLASFSWEVPTQTQAIELSFEASDLTIGGVVTITPAALANITSTVKADGSILVYGYDAYGNARIGDPVTVTVEVNGLKAIVETVTADPAVEAKKVEEAAVVAAASEGWKARTVEEVKATGLNPDDGTYTVQRGDTLSVIAKAFGTTVDAIVSANGLTNPSLIHGGNVLVIPPDC